MFKVIWVAMAIGMPNPYTNQVMYVNGHHTSLQSCKQELALRREQARRAKAFALTSYKCIKMTLRPDGPKV